jgi:hypothetical protein
MAGSQHAERQRQQSSSDRRGRPRDPGPGLGPGDLLCEQNADRGCRADAERPEHLGDEEDLDGATLRDNHVRALEP